MLVPQRSSSLYSFQYLFVEQFLAPTLAVQHHSHYLGFAVILDLRVSTTLTTLAHCPYEPVWQSSLGARGTLLLQRHKNSQK